MIALACPYVIVLNSKGMCEALNIPIKNVKIFFLLKYPHY
jgi:hypothetical protein